MAKLLTTDSMEEEEGYPSPTRIEESPWIGHGIAYSKRMSASDTDCLNGREVTDVLFACRRGMECP